MNWNEILILASSRKSFKRNPELTHNEFENRKAHDVVLMYDEGDAIINIQLRDPRAASPKGAPKVTQPKDWGLNISSPRRIRIGKDDFSLNQIPSLFPFKAAC